MRNLWNLSVKSFGITARMGLGTGRTWRPVLMGLFICGVTVAVPFLALGSVESSLAAVQDKLVGTLLPLAAICGLAFAGMSFVMGNPNARMHLIWACVGAIVGFGAESIVTLIRSVIQ